MPRKQVAPCGTREHITSIHPSIHPINIDLAPTLCHALFLALGDSIGNKTDMGPFLRSLLVQETDNK